VIAVDTNILVYAHRKDSAFHTPAMNVVRSLAEGVEQWAIPWPCVHEFLAIVTHPKVFSPPSTTDEALTQVDLWFQSPTLTVVGESEKHWATLRDLALKARLQGPIFHDARIAAICKDHGIRELWSADRDLSRFTTLNTRNPLLP